MTTASNVLRTIVALVLNLLTAALGTAIAEAEFYNVVHPQTVAGMYTKELVLSGTVAFVLGCVVYFKWRTSPAFHNWVWVLGVVGFAWRVLLGNEPPTIYDEAQRATLGFVSVRFVAYSAGALCCAGLVKPIAKRVTESQAAEES